MFIDIKNPITSLVFHNCFILYNDFIKEQEEENENELPYYNEE
jgi:hypothetical protein